MTTKADNQYQVKCPSCGEMVYPVINIKDDEQPNDHAWAECPKCGFNTGNREDEMDAFKFFENPGRINMQTYLVTLAVKDANGSVSIVNAHTHEYDLETVQGILDFKKEYGADITILFLKKLKG